MQFPKMWKSSSNKWNSNENGVKRALLRLNFDCDLTKLNTVTVYGRILVIELFYGFFTIEYA